MCCFPLCIIALAAGVHLVIKSKREYLGGLYAGLSWLVVVLSLGCMAYCGYHHFNRNCGKHEKRMQHCRVEKQGCISTHDGGKCGPEDCCMQGDSCVMNRDACERMMGKTACDSLVQLRGACVFAKEECKSLCTAGSVCCAKSDAKSGCCKQEKAGGSCTKK